MWVRAVAVVAAVVVGCVSGAAMAAGYTEVWNPPEASGHALKPVKRRSRETKVRTGTSSKHPVGMQRKSSKLASSAVRGDRTAAHAGVKKVSAKAGVKQPGMSKLKPKAAVVAQANKPHAQPVRAQGAQGGVRHASMNSGHSARPHAVNVAAKPALSHPHAPVASTNPSVGPANANSNPSMASSGSLPPIIH
jgi:hypothetical protein